MTKEIEPVACMTQHGTVCRMKPMYKGDTPLYGPEAMERIKELEAENAELQKEAMLWRRAVTFGVPAEWEKS